MKAANVTIYDMEDVISSRLEDLMELFPKTVSSIIKNNYYLYEVINTVCFSEKFTYDNDYGETYSVVFYHDKDDGTVAVRYIDRDYEITSEMYSAEDNFPALSKFLR